jgi:ubiquinol-cytochrome c reductase cytochrome c subunit
VRDRYPGLLTRLLALLAVGGIAVPVTLLLAPASGSASSGSTAAGDVRPIRTVYLGDCAVCHGADARGTDRGPSLLDVGAAGVDFWVSTGRMPLSSPDAVPTRHTPHYSPARIRQLVSYVVGLTGRVEPRIPQVDLRNADLADGATQYRLNCAACHAATGVGGALFHREAPKVTDATATQAAEAMRIGPGQMPAFGTAALDRRQLDDTTAYVRYLANPNDRGGFDLWHFGPLAEGGAIALLGLLPLVLAVRWIGTRR